MSFNCLHQNICGSCSRPEWNPSEQAQFKQDLLFSALNPDILSASSYQKPTDIDYISLLSDPNKPNNAKSIENYQIRDRADLIYDPSLSSVQSTANIGLGFYQKTGERKIFSLEQCSLMSPRLLDVFSRFKKILSLHPPSTQHKGSVRLRTVVAPAAVIGGVWLDFANTDIKILLDEKTFLNALLDSGFYVEIGQKRKALTVDHNKNFKLKDPQFHFFNQTWIANLTSVNGSTQISQQNISLKPFALQSCVGSFSQSGSLANYAINARLISYYQKTSAKKWLEFGAGCGNLTFPLASLGVHVHAVELEPLAAQALLLNQQRFVQQHPSAGHIQISVGDFHREKSIHEADIHFSQFQGVLVNPPRSGLKDFLNPLAKIEPKSRPKDLIYMSCYLDSFATDANQLFALGYRLQDLSIVDQFPQTEHFEILSRWQLI